MRYWILTIIISQWPITVQADVNMLIPDSFQSIHNCGIELLRQSGKIGPESIKLPALYTKASVSTDQDFMVHVLAVIYVESRFNKQAKSGSEAYGLMQMTEIAVEEAARNCHLRRVTMNSLYDSHANVKYGTCYLNKLLREMGGDWDRTLIVYNGGYTQLAKYDRGDNIAAETANYLIQVNRAIKSCSKPTN